MRVSAAVATAILLMSGKAGADVFPAPAHPGDFSLGLGPALTLDPGSNASPAVAAEANLLLGSYTLGVHGHVADQQGAIKGAVGLEASVLGLIGAGLGYRPDGGFSVDGLLNVPIPILPKPFFLGLSWRPSFLFQGGISHELALQIRWTSLLLPED